MRGKHDCFMAGLAVLLFFNFEVLSTELTAIQSVQKSEINLERRPVSDNTICNKIVFDQYRFYSETTTDFTVMRYVGELIPNNCAGISLNVKGAELYLPTGELTKNDYAYRITHEFERRYGLHWKESSYSVRYENNPAHVISGNDLIAYLNKQFKNSRPEVVYITQQ